VFIDHHPGVSDGFGSKRPGGEIHLGVDIMYLRRSPTDFATNFPPGTPNGAPWAFMPDGTYALAAGPGVVTRAGAEKRGQAVTISHGKAATFYTHMESLLVAQDAQVVAGQPIGIIGADPLDAEHLKHLHFEIWPSGARASAVNPEPLLKRWDLIVIDEGKPRVIPAVS
jgi:murein DD-endopeptidase MepM/ murein hydrolase activator NlpD